MNFYSLCEYIEEAERKNELKVKSHDSKVIQEIVSIVSEVIFNNVSVAEMLYRNGERRCRIKRKKKK